MWSEAAGPRQPLWTLNPQYSKSVAKLCSALGASSGQNLTTVLGSHSLEEAVLLFSVYLFGLIGSLNLSHFITSLSIKTWADV